MDELIVALVTKGMRSADSNVERLSEESGIPRVTLRRRLKEGVSFTVDELDRIANALDLDILDLIPTRKMRSELRRSLKRDGAA